MIIKIDTEIELKQWSDKKNWADQRVQYRK